MKVIIRKAIKIHKCDFCGEDIIPGGTYNLNTVFPWDKKSRILCDFAGDTPIAYKFHIKCRDYNDDIH